MYPLSASVLRLPRRSHTSGQPPKPHFPNATIPAAAHARAAARAVPERLCRVALVVAAPMLVYVALFARPGVLPPPARGQGAPAPPAQTQLHHTHLLHLQEQHLQQQQGHQHHQRQQQQYQHQHQQERHRQERQVEHLRPLIRSPHDPAAPRPASQVTGTAPSGHHQRQRNALLPYTPPHLRHPPLVHLVGHDPAAPATLYARNSRSFALLAAFCIRPSTPTALSHLYYGADPQSARCQRDDPGLRPLLRPSSLSSSSSSHSYVPVPVSRADCAHAHTRIIQCAHGRYQRRDNHPMCPPVHTLGALTAADNASATWLGRDAVALVVPPFPWLNNIFHFSFVVAHVTHVLTELGPLLSSWHVGLDPASAMAFRAPGVGAGASTQLSGAGASGRQREGEQRFAPPRKVTVIFRDIEPAELSRRSRNVGPDGRELRAWHASITELLLRRRGRLAGIAEVNVVGLREDARETGAALTGNTAAPVCAHSGVLLGDRPVVTLWPFANGSAVSPAGDAAPAQSLAFRRAVYDEFGIASRLPGLPDSPRGAQWPRTAVIEPPPLVVGYARRERVPDPAPPKRFIRDYWRRFSDGDDAWFEAALHEEAARVGARVTELTPRVDTPLEEQVRWFSGVGFLVGIHGANLVNELFMRPFGALLEIIPGNLVIRCYEAGSNSGLAYFSHNAANATMDESFCAPTARCARERVQRRVKISEQAHRDEIRRKLRLGLAHIVRIRQRFPHGVPIRLEEPENRYVIDWHAKPEQ